MITRFLTFSLNDGYHGWRRYVIETLFLWAIWNAGHMNEIGCIFFLLSKMQWEVTQLILLFIPVRKLHRITFMLYLATILYPTATQIVEPSCSPEVPVCEVHLVLEHRYTMMHYSNGDDGTMRPVVVKDDGNFYAKSSCTSYTKLNQEGMCYFSFSNL